MARKREFSDIRHRQSVDPLLNSSKKTELVCVNCFNQKMIAGKQARRGPPQPLPEFPFGRPLSQSHNKSMCEGQLRTVTEFNLKKIEENQRNRERQRQKARVNEEATQLEEEYRKQQLERRNIQVEKKSQLKEELQKQIAAARGRKAAREYEDKGQPMRAFIGTDLPSDSGKKETQYQQDLLRQMQERKEAKRREAEEEAQDGLLQLVTFAEQRRATQIESQVRERQVAAEDARRREMRERIKKETLLTLRGEEEQQRKKLRRQEEGAKMGQDRERREQIDRYLRDLKNQMEDNRGKREKEKRKLEMGKQNAGVMFGGKPPVDYSCACCSRKYPKQCLSPYIP